MRLAAGLCAALLPGLAAAQSPALTGAAAFGDWRGDAPPAWQRRITAADLPPPYASRSAGNPPSVDEAPPGAALARPARLHRHPLRPTGWTTHGWCAWHRTVTSFVAETAAGRVRVLRAADGAATPSTAGVFASGLSQPFGIAFYPPGPDPRWVYVATLNTVDALPLCSPATCGRSGRPETGGAAARRPIRAGTRRGTSSSRLDGRRMFVSVGSNSNVAQGMARRDPDARSADWQAQNGLGAAWGNPRPDRADVLSFNAGGWRPPGLRHGDPQLRGPGRCTRRRATLWLLHQRAGRARRQRPAGLRDTRWPPGSFYGWPWYYTGDHEDPRHARASPAGTSSSQVDHPGRC